MSYEESAEDKLGRRARILQDAILSDDRPLVGYLVEAGLEPWTQYLDGDSALFAAVREERPEILKLLVEHSFLRLPPDEALAKVFYSDEMPLVLYAGAFLRPSSFFPGSILECLLDAGGNLNERATKPVPRFNVGVGDSLLHLAAGAGARVVCCDLVLRGAEINHRNASGETPLVVALYGSDLDVAQELFALGAHIEESALSPPLPECGRAFLDAARAKTLLGKGRARCKRSVPP